MAVLHQTAVPVTVGFAAGDHGLVLDCRALRVRQIPLDIVLAVDRLVGELHWTLLIHLVKPLPGAHCLFLFDTFHIGDAQLSQRRVSSRYQGLLPLGLPDDHEDAATRYTRPA